MLVLPTARLDVAKTVHNVGVNCGGQQSLQLRFDYFVLVQNCDGRCENTTDRTGQIPINNLYFSGQIDPCV